jgi:adenylate cyclase
VHVVRAFGLWGTVDYRIGALRWFASPVAPIVERLAARDRSAMAITADDINRWIVAASLAGEDECDIVAGAAERLVAAGVPLMRIALASDMLDPSYDTLGVRWTRGEGAIHETFLRTDSDDASEEWLTSPFYVLVMRGEDRLRRRLDESYRPGEFPVLDQFRARGATDYYTMIARLGQRMWLGETRGVLASWLTDAPRGFDDAAIALLEQTLPSLSTSFLWRSMQRTARALLTTYLGTDAAQRVLDGNVVRGRAETIPAVVWYSDLVGFTRITDVEAADHVLKFIGDGMLAIFPDGDQATACVRALDAAAEQRRRVDAVNDRRRASGQPVTDTHVALHLGDLLYGNVGSPRRLDFTVLGAAVNEAARIEALCGSLDQKVIVSSAFAQACGTARNRLVSLGRYAMKGVARPQELYTLDPERSAADSQIGTG